MPQAQQHIIQAPPVPMTFEEMQTRFDSDWQGMRNPLRQFDGTRNEIQQITEAAEPTVDDVHVDIPLTNFSIHIANTMFNAFDVCPKILVASRSGQYLSIDDGTDRTDEVRTVAPGTAPVEIGFDAEWLDYSVRKYGLRTVVTEDELHNATNPLRPRQVKIQRMMRLMMGKLDHDVATTFTTTGNYDSDNVISVATNDKFDAYTTTGNNPFAYVEYLKDNIELEVCQEPNLLVMSPNIFRALINHPQLGERLKHNERWLPPSGSSGDMDIDNLRRAFRIDKVVVYRSSRTTSRQGDTNVRAYTWGNFCGLYYNDPMPGLDTALYAGIIVWQPYDFMTQSAMINPIRGVEELAIKAAWDVKRFVQGAGLLMTNVLSTARA